MTTDILVIIGFIGLLLYAVSWAVPRAVGASKGHMPQGEYDQSQPFDPTESVEVIIDGKIHPITYTHVTQEKYNDMVKNEAKFFGDAENLN